VRAVTDVSFGVEPGQVTGFLGPNGAGKTTTLRMVLGLVRPSAGTVTVDGRPYAHLGRPLSRVGAALDGAARTPAAAGGTTFAGWRQRAGIPVRRCDEVLELTGLADAARRRAGGYSLGMQQRLALAAPCSATRTCWCSTSPPTAWTPRDRLAARVPADAGRRGADGAGVQPRPQRGRADRRPGRRPRCRARRLRRRAVGPGRSDRRARRLPGPLGLAAALAAQGLAAVEDRSGALLVRPPDGSPDAVDPVRVGAVAAAAGVALSHLAPTSQRLEEAFLRLVQQTELTAAATRRQQPPPAQVAAGGAA
jgi:ABC-2 type transport system ATP-binding protein